MHLPIVDDMEIPALGLTLVDQEALPKEVGLRGRKILVDVLQTQVLRQQRVGTFLCAMEQSEFQDKLYREAQERNPRLTLIEFLATGVSVVEDDSDCNPRLGVKNFVVYASNQEILGLFTLYNIEIERDVEEGITASAMAMPGCRPALGFTMRETWGGIMRAILENDFVMGGRKVDFDEWRFPTRRGHQWKLSGRELDIVGESETAAAVPERGLFVGDLDGHDLTKDPDGVPLKVRRREEPRQFPPDLGF